MEKKKEAAALPKSTGRKPYCRPELTRYQRLQELTRGDSPTGSAGISTCAIKAHCETSPT